MKGVEVEEFRDVELYPDEELYVVVVRKNSKLRLDEDQLMEKLEPWTNRLQLLLEDGSSSLWSLFICRQVHYSSVDSTLFIY
ncbi:hypothetical protein Taro_052804 [Colocasia esculenta]|uniref:Uncharacterized protein n=1 Tax=Colocasia esculenta TaxID=4460 RepID=A0A843XKS0_COLES|nr:hypothetical protein [Colocasia esculenta]